MKRKIFLLFTFVLIFFVKVKEFTYADLQEDVENMHFEFIFPQDGETVVIENCKITKHVDHALRLEYEASFSPNIKLRLTAWELDSDQKGIVTYHAYDFTANFVIWGTLTTTTYAFKAEATDAEDKTILNDGWQITYDVVCLNELNKEEKDKYLNIPEPKRLETKENIVETKEAPKEEKIEITAEPEIKGIKKIVETITKIFTDIRDIFTWNISFEDIDWDAILPKQEEIKEETQKEAKEEKPFGFPFEKIIGVTQWYGNTAYQKPHTGIDFGATKEIIISPGDGEIVALGWDNFNGECFSGGNYLVLKHTNGMHTAYFHIEKYFAKLGDKVEKGERIAVSGNSGKWNCQNLGYHLHFETRLGRYQNTHVNPVNYISTNWEDIPTLGYKQNPGRLSGENPHPTY